MLLGNFQGVGGVDNFPRLFSKKKYPLYLSGSWCSSENDVICSSVPMMSVIADSWARESEISSSYSEKAWDMNSYATVSCSSRPVMVSRVRAPWKYVPYFIAAGENKRCPQMYLQVEP